MSNLGKPGCKECRVRPGGKVRVTDAKDPHCVGCGEPVHGIALVPDNTGPVRAAADKPWRPGDAAPPAAFGGAA